MDKQKQIKKMAKIIKESNLCGFACDTCKYKNIPVVNECKSNLLAEELYNAGYRKIPENAVVLTEKELYDKGYRKVCEPVIRNGEVVGFVSGADYVPKNLFLFGISNARKETAEKFAPLRKYITEQFRRYHEVRDEAEQSYKTETNEIMKSVCNNDWHRADAIMFILEKVGIEYDEICEEITGEKGSYIDCHKCKHRYDCERTYLGGCTDGEEWSE